MEEDITCKSDQSIPLFEHLDEWVRFKVQGFIQSVLEEEVENLLGRSKGERRKAVDGVRGYRNGYGKPRRLSLMTGTVTLKRPRVRNLEERFESRMLPLFQRRTKAIGELLPELYLHGLANGDFELALRGLLGDGAPLSSTSIQRLKGKWESEYRAWSEEDLSGVEPVYVWADGVYVKAGIGKDKAALLVVIGAMSDGTKRILAVESGFCESMESWSTLLRSLKSRGLKAPRLVVADGHLGIWSALAGIYPEAEEQRCWNHKIVNVLDRLPKRVQPEANAVLTLMPYAASRAECEKLKERFQRSFGSDYPKAIETLSRDWERMTAFYNFPSEHWKHLRTSNVVESPFAAVRLRTGAARRFKKVSNATALIWKVLMVAEKRFNKLNAPELMKGVYNGAEYIDGKRVLNEEDKDAA